MWRNNVHFLPGIATHASLALQFCIPLLPPHVWMFKIIILTTYNTTHAMHYLEYSTAKCSDLIGHCTQINISNFR